MHLKKSKIHFVVKQVNFEFEVKYENLCNNKCN